MGHVGHFKPTHMFHPSGYDVEAQIGVSGFWIDLGIFKKSVSKELV